jgi:hypothetical protein
MYFVSRAEGIFHLADDDMFTLCKRYMPLTPRRRYDDYQLVEHPPADRVCVLCSDCATLSGDNRGFKQRIIYPRRNRLSRQGKADRQQIRDT